MFIGHYSAALALKRVEKNASLGWLFIAVQFVDILFFILVLLGVERLNIVENFTPSTHFELAFFPYTHSLAGTLVWAAVAYLIFRMLPAKAGADKGRIAFVIAAAVCSHWFLDLIVHTPDLPLLGDASPKLGFGLWNSAALTFALEAALVLGGVWLYLSGRPQVASAGRVGMLAMAVFLILLNGFTLFGPPPESVGFMAVFSLAVYLLFGGLTFWLDRKRN